MGINWEMRKAADDGQVYKAWEAACWANLRGRVHLDHIKDCYMQYHARIHGDQRPFDKVDATQRKLSVQFYEALLAVPAIRNSVLNPDAPMECLLGGDRDNPDHGIKIRNDLRGDWWLNVASWFRYPEEGLGMLFTTVKPVCIFLDAGYPPYVALIMGSLYTGDDAKYNNTFGSGHQQIGINYIGKESNIRIARKMNDPSFDVREIGKVERLDVAGGYSQAQQMWGGGGTKIPNPLTMDTTVEEFIGEWFNATIDKETGEVTYHG